jgi:hypothetical protein
MRLRLPLLAPLAPLAAVAGLAAAAPAHAGFFGAQTIDGPSADVVAFGDADLARDGSGALAYVKKDGGVDHIFVSLVVDGAIQPGARVDTGLANASSKPSVGVAAGGRVVVSFLNGAAADKDLWAVDKAPGGGFGAPQAINANPANTFADTDMGPSGVAYTTYVTHVGAAYDVRASRYENGAWSPVGDAYPGPLGKLEANAAKDAGGQFETQPRVAVDGTGNAVVAFSEGTVGADQLGLQVRRLAGTAVGSIQDASVPSLVGFLRGTTAWMADVDTDDAGNASVAFREDFTYGGFDKARALVRRLPAGSATFDPPVVFDGLAVDTNPGNGAEVPRVDVNGAGAGLAATRRQMMPYSVYGAAMTSGTWVATPRIDAVDENTTVPEPVAAIAGNGAGLIAWKTAGTMRARYGAGGAFFGEATISDPALGAIEAIGTHEAAADNAGDAVIGFTQGTAATRRIVAAVFDVPPSPPAGTTSESYTAERRPTLRWTGASDAWGPLMYRLEVDGKTVATTAGTSFQLLDSLGDGTHPWRVVAVDRRGQEAPSAFRAYRLDVKRPRVSLSIKGKRRVGSKVTFSIKNSDGRGVGVKTIRFAVSGGNTAKTTRVTRRFRKKGKAKIKITVKDAVGNATTIKRTIRIKAAPRKKKKKK